jgi:hypothetical protein
VIAENAQAAAGKVAGEIQKPNCLAHTKEDIFELALVQVEFLNSRLRTK